MNKQILALAFCTLVTSPAATVSFNDRTTFLAAISGATDFDFQVPAAPAAISDVGAGQVGLTTVAGAGSVSLQVYGSTQAIGGRTTIGELNNFLAVLLTFNTSITAFGFDNLDLTGLDTEYAIVTVNFADASPAETFTFTTPTNLAPQFFGLTSTSAIASVQVHSGDTPTSAPGGRANLIDNLVIGQADPVDPGTALPEPETLLTAAAGVLLIAAGRRARR
jgi:hypothetical protein